MIAESERLTALRGVGERVEPSPPWPLRKVMEFFQVCDKTVKKLVRDGLLERVPGTAKVLITDSSVRRLAGERGSNDGKRDQ